MCFEKPPKKWLFETHVASGRNTTLHSGLLALQEGRDLTPETLPVSSVAGARGGRLEDRTLLARRILLIQLVLLVCRVLPILGRRRLVWVVRLRVLRVRLVTLTLIPLRLVRICLLLRGEAAHPIMRVRRAPMLYLCFTSALVWRATCRGDA